MFQQNLIAQTFKNEIAYKSGRRSAQLFVRVLQSIWHVICKIATLSLNGFHTIMTNAQQHQPPQNGYWWDSREKVDKLFER